jgi:osmotically-inducible protein OsmY
VRASWRSRIGELRNIRNAQCIKRDLSDCLVARPPSIRSEAGDCKLSQTIKGVRSVIDQVNVTPIARTDDQLATDVKTALHDDIATRTYAITVAAKDGKVTLAGTADSWQQKNLAGEVAKAVPGLKTIDDAITVHYSMDRPSAEMATDIKARLANDVWLDGDIINVTVTGHTPKLSGLVGSVSQALRARSDAWVAGTDAVDDTGMVVDWMAENDQRRAISDPMRSDSQVTQAIKDAFRFDARLKTFVPEVKVNEGAVVLTDTLDSAKARLAAASDARDTLGVWNVRNELVVQPSGTPSDADIVQDATRMIVGDLPPGEAKSIQVTSGRRPLLC